MYFHDTYTIYTYILSSLSASAAVRHVALGATYIAAASPSKGKKEKTALTALQMPASEGESTSPKR